MKEAREHFIHISVQLLKAKNNLTKFEMTLSEGNLRRIQANLNDILECSICRDVFEDARMLPCIHSFCLNCLKQTLNDNSEDRITCPMCRSEFPLAQNGFEGLPKNFFLMGLKETMQIVKATSTANTSCDICGRGASAAGEAPTAEMYCSDCKEKLCKNCCSLHITNVSDRKHTLIAITDNPEREVKVEPDVLVYCDIHKQHPINIYCLNCKEVLCAMCYIEKHLNHERKSIADASKEFRDQIQESMTILSPEKDNLLKNKDELENEKLAVRLETGRLEKAILETRDAIVKRADDDAKSLLLMLNLKKSEKQKDIEILKDNVIFKHTCLDSYLNYCKQISRKGSDVDICREAYYLESRANELQQSTSTSVNRLSSEFQMLFKQSDLETFQAQNNVIGVLNEVQDSNKIMENDKLQHSQESENTLEVESINISDTNTQNDKEDSTATKSKGSDFLKSTDDGVLVRSLESSSESTRSSFFNWIFSSSTSDGDISETESYSEKRNHRNSESEDGNLNNHDTLWIHTIKMKSSEDDTHPICGITILYNELYVVSDKSSTIQVYDTTAFALVRELRSARLIDPGDIASCAKNSCIYVIDWKSHDQSNEVLKVDANGVVVKKWRTPDDYSWLSVTHEYHVVVTLHEKNEINEYESDGCLIRSIKLSPKVDHLWHAIKLTNGDFMISHGLKDLHRVCRVDFNGTVTNSFGENSDARRLRSAVYLAEDSRGSILVVDQSRGRVVQLDSHLEFQKQLVTTKHKLFSPIRIHLDASSGRLFVADRKCLISTFNFE